MSHKSFRPRPIDVSKKLPIIRSSNELAAIRDDDDGPSIDVAQPHHGMDPDSDEVCVLRIYYAQSVAVWSGQRFRAAAPAPNLLPSERSGHFELLP